MVCKIEVPERGAQRDIVDTTVGASQSHALVLTVTEPPVDEGRLGARGLSDIPSDEGVHERRLAGVDLADDRDSQRPAQTRAMAGEVRTQRHEGRVGGQIV